MTQIKPMDSHEVHLTDKLKWGEDVLAISVFFAITFLPFYDTIARIFKLNSIPASQIIIQHLTLWTGFLGAILATRQNKLLALTRKPLFTSDDDFNFGRWISKSVSFIILCALIWGSFQLVKIEFQFPIYIAPHIPRWAAQIIMPVGFIFIALEVILRSGSNAIYRSSILMVTIGWYIICLSGNLQDSGWFPWIGSFIILFSVYQGLPIFLALGGLAVLYFWIDYTPIASIAAETYRIVVSPTLPTIPLFTLAGYILAESGAPKRIYKFFTHAFGWLQGGTPIIVVLLCAFFTALTGGSGVTILALGGILYPLLKKEGYSEKFSLGLITVSGSLGLLFPPSLPDVQPAGQQFCSQTLEAIRVITQAVRAIRFETLQTSSYGNVSINGYQIGYGIKSEDNRMRAQLSYSDFDSISITATGNTITGDVTGQNKVTADADVVAFTIGLGF